jgi:hypothetical protein
MSKIVIDKGKHPVRGFLSYYISVLTSYRQLVGRQEINPKEIAISSDIFFTYADASNWFEDFAIRQPQQGDIIYDSTDSWDLDPWPSNKQLDLLEYKKYFDYNDRVKNYLNDKMPDLSNAIGIHFRGTDHYHTDRIEVEKYIEAVEQEWQTGKYDKIFIATDELFVVEKFKEKLSCKNIIENDTIKSYGNLSVFDMPMDKTDKIKAGDEVLLDSHCLSQCDVVFGKLSNVNYYSRILNPSLDVRYLDLGSQVR